MNPRVLLWLEAVGLTPADIVRRSGEDVPLVTVDGRRSMWTICFSEWITARWAEWAHELGFRARNGSPAHRVALLSGHTDAEFDAWLEAHR